ncbi:helix-turn-helix domain-containing protein [Nocardia tengchongensis]|uniref:MmyB family transcriptional regulator n=1 Tax=Nocardia tengchongensis TaxID=2055889 RepID=UPI0036C151E6
MSVSRDRRPTDRYRSVRLVPSGRGLVSGMVGLIEAVPLPTPSFGDFLRHLRDERSLSREGLAKSAGVSASYINHLEIGRRDHPTRPIVEALAGRLERALPLSDDERRYLFDLAGLLDIEVPAVADLRADISPEMLRRIDRCGSDPAGYFDLRWNILAVNEAAHQAFPGLREIGNVMHWLLSDGRSDAVLAEYDQVVEYAVAALRARIALPRNSEWAGQLLAELCRYPEFARRWAAGRVTYALAQPALRLRDCLSGKQFRIELQLYDVDTARHPGWTRMFWGIGVR